MSKGKSKRIRCFICVLYDDVSLVEQFCTSPRLKSFAYIKHDRDIDKNGKPVESHIHLLLEYFNARTETSLRTELADFFTQNCFTEVCEDKYSALDYFIHKFNKDKFQYNVSDVVTNITNAFTDKAIDNVALCILSDMEAKLSLRELAKRYGREIVLNYNRYRDYLSRIKEEEQGERLYLLSVNDVISLIDNNPNLCILDSDVKQLSILEKLNNLEVEKNEKL